MSKVLTLGYEYEHDYNLIAINSTLDDYRLAFFLNKNLEIQLERQANNLDFIDKNCSFSLYNYDCNITFSSWSLVANKHIFISKNTEKTNLFTEETKISYLLNEKKGVDFFLKIFGDFNFESLSLIVNNIKGISGVITSYTIDPQTLKSKDFLIF